LILYSGTLTHLDRTTCVSVVEGGKDNCFGIFSFSTQTEIVTFGSPVASAQLFGGGRLDFIRMRQIETRSWLLRLCRRTNGGLSDGFMMFYRGGRSRLECGPGTFLCRCTLTLKLC